MSKDLDYDKIARGLGVTGGGEKEPPDYDKIAEGLRTQRGGKVVSGGGYFGAMELAAEVAARFKTPASGGRATDPSWTERRLVPLTSQTLERLEELSTKLREQKGLRIEPMQLAALLLERAAQKADEEAAEELLQGQ